MKSKLLTTLFLGTIISGTMFIENPQETSGKPNCIRVSSGILLPNNKSNFDDFWTPNNESFLNEEQKEKIHNLRDRVESGNYLTIQEKSIIKSIKSEVIRIKLGDDKFAELQKLIEKREGSTELTVEERTKLYELDKQATG